MAIGREVLHLAQTLGYTFFDISYLECAVTHSSYVNEQRSRGIRLISNERMEFLGDAVLGMLVSEHIYNNYKKYAEGKLSVLRRHIVCERSLAQLASELHLGEYLNLGNGEEADCRNLPRVLADAMEAVIGAIYLDSVSAGSDRYREVILRLLSPLLEDNAHRVRPDYKTALQQLVEQDGSATLEYATVRIDGPEHAKCFTVEVRVNNNLVGTGEGKTIKAAQMTAAFSALKLFGVDL